MTSCRIAAGLACACLAGMGMVERARGAGIGNTLFLHHFDAPIGEGAGTADYANGDPAEQILPPFGPGGLTVSSPVKFGSGSLYRFNGQDVGGRVEYNLAGNFDLQRGTIEMWINSGSLTAGGFVGLWGTEAATGPGDVRMYIYDTGAGRTLGAYMYSSSFWECEQAIPAAALTNNQWHHVAWTWDLSAKTTAIYWDGQALRTTPDAGTVGFGGAFNPVRFHIGENQFGSAPFPGFIDELRISDVDRYQGQSFTPQTEPFSVAQGSQWGVDADGNWSVSGNWIGGVPNSSGATASFTSAISAARTVTVDIPVTVGSINFQNTKSYTIAGTSTLTLNSTGPTAIGVASGSHAIAAPISVQKDLTVTVGSAADTLTISGEMSAAAAILTKAGPGTLAAGHVRALELAVNAGTVRIASKAAANDPSGTGRVTALSIAPTAAAPAATLDLTNNAFIIDYSGASPLGDLRQLLLAGVASGRGVVSSSADSTRGLGYAEASALGVSSFAGQTVDADAVLIKFTYAGDTNLDGQVDVIDLGNLATGWQTSGTWINGDSNYDGFIDVIDLGTLATNWQAGVGSPLGPGSLDDALASYGLSSAGVPEPAGLGAGAWACGGILLRRRQGCRLH